MSDRNRRKSSILKLPKSNARAPLQDVNTLDCKATQDDDFTSHTALGRRRVSFAGKNFVKEFCSEADIASVYHAPEYEELLASAESSGLVTSDSSNTHSSTTLSENNSTFASRTHLSAYRSVSIQDEYDPSDEIMRQFKGEKAPPPEAETQKPSRKNRFSFGDICIPQFEEENAPPLTVQAPSGFISGTTVMSHVGNVHVTSQNINPCKEHLTATKATKTELHSVTFNAEEKARRSPMCEDITTPPDHNGPTHSFIGSEASTCTMVDSVFESTEDLLPKTDPNLVANNCKSTDPRVPVPHTATAVACRDMLLFSDERVVCEVADTTQCMNESMDFTKAVPGIIHVGCLENPVPDNILIQPEHIMEFLPHSKTQIMCTSMELTQAMSSNIDFQHYNKNSVVVETENQVRHCSEDENTSLELPGPVPSTVQAESSTHGVNKKDNRIANQTVAVETSMEFTRPVPSNIHVGFATGDNAVIPKIADNICNHTPAINTAMEFIKPVPSNIQVGFATEEVGVPEKENRIANQTVAMETSMEFTRPVPSNIHVGCGSGDNAVTPRVRNNIGDHIDFQHYNKNSVLVETENQVRHCTEAENTSLELPGPVPSTVQAESSTHGVNKKDNRIANQTVAMETSMEFTRPVPSNIHVGFATGDDAVIPKIADNIGDHTAAINTAMEFTKPVPSNIQVGFATEEVGSPEKENRIANQTVAMETSMEFTRPVPSNIHVGFVTDDNTDVLKTTDIGDCTVASNNSMELRRPVPSNIQGRFSSHQIAGIPVEENNVTNPTTKFKVGYDQMKSLENDVTEQHFTMHFHGTHEFPLEQPEHSPCHIDDSFSLPPDPFKSTPRLMYSPRTLSGIEAVHVQSLLKKVKDQDQIELKHFDSGTGPPIVPEHHETSSLSKEVTCNDPSKSKSSPTPFRSVDTAVDEVSGPGANSTATLSLSRSPDRTALKASLETEEPNLLLDVSNPFRCKYQLINTPIKEKNEVPVSVSPNIIGVDVQNSADGNDKNDCVQSTEGNVHGVIGNDNWMLSDEPPVLIDGSSINIESVNDSGSDLLHTTIRNAEITLRQMHSSSLIEIQPGPILKDMNCSVTALEGMDCDPLHSEQITIQQTGSTILPSKNLFAASCHHSQQITSHGDDAGIRISRKSEEGDKIDEKRTAKRSRDPSVDCGRFDPESSDNCTTSKRLCKVRSEAVSVHHQETSNCTLGSDLSDDMSDTLGKSNSGCSASSSAELGDIIMKPHLWKAVKIGEDLWSFKFNSHCLELKVHLKLSSTADGIVEGSNGQFVMDVTSEKPLICWGMDILMDKLQTPEWDALLYYSPNFLRTMEKLTKMVIENKSFLAEMIIQEGVLNLKFSRDSFKAKIMSLKLHFCFELTVKLDLLERYSPDHIQVENIIGTVRATEVKNFITGVKKDLYLVRNYIRDVKDYVKTLESFCS